MLRAKKRTFKPILSEEPEVAQKVGKEEPAEEKPKNVTAIKLNRKKVENEVNEKLIFPDLDSYDDESSDEEIDQLELKLANNTEEKEEKTCVWSDDEDDSNQRNFEKIMGPEPDWAKPKKVDPNMEMFNKKILAKGSKYLPHSNLDIMRCTDLNKEETSARKLESCEFHPNARMALTASKDCRIHLFQVDGKRNAKIHTLFMESFPIRSAHFLTGGTEILLTSHQPHIYAYDLVKGQTSKSSFIKGVRDKTLKNFKVSPNGKHLVFLSSYGRMHIVDQKNKELIRTLKMAGSVEDIAFFNNGESMLSYGDDGEVYTWDMNSLKCSSTYQTEAGMYGLSIACTKDGSKIALGTRGGCVDLYEIVNSMPKLLKTFKNLNNAPVTTLKFNNCGEILAMASNCQSNMVKLVHTAHLSVFSNFPMIEHRNLGEVYTVDFSPNDGYMSVGNYNGRAHLYRINHYASY